MLRHIAEKVGDVRTIHNAIVAAPVADEGLQFGAFLFFIVFVHF